MARIDMRKTAAELIDWLAFASMLGVSWLLSSRWPLIPAVVATVVYALGMIIGVGYLRALLRPRDNHIDMPLS